MRLIDLNNRLLYRTANQKRCSGLASCNSWWWQTLLQRRGTVPYACFRLRKDKAQAAQQGGGTMVDSGNDGGECVREDAMRGGGGGGGSKWRWQPGSR